MSVRNGSPASWPQLWVDHELAGPPRGELFEPPRNTEHFVRVKPKHGTGFWTSPLRADGTCGWIEWLAYEDWWPHDRRDPPAYVLEPAPDARVLTISSLADLKATIAAFPYEAPNPIHFGDRGIDFEAAAGIYDAIHLTEAGQWATRMTDPSLYGWDCESVLWLRWHFVHARASERSAAELAHLVLEADAAAEASA